MPFAPFLFLLTDRKHCSAELLNPTSSSLPPLALPDLVTHIILPCLNVFSAKNCNCSVDVGNQHYYLLNWNWDQRWKYWHNLPLGSSLYTPWFDTSELVFGGGGGGNMSGFPGGGGGKMFCPFTVGGGGSVRRRGGSGGSCRSFPPFVSDWVVTSLKFFVISELVSTDADVEVSEKLNILERYIKIGVIRHYFELG